MCHLNLCIKKWGSPSLFRRKRPFISLNSLAFIENLSSSEGARARARANHARNDAQKGCVMQLNGITLSRTNQPVRLTLKDICIGIISSECPLLNYLLLIGKLYLWDCRRSNKLPDIAGFKVKVDIKYQIEKYVCTKTNKSAKFQWKWKR